MIFADAQIDTTIHQSSSVLKHISDTVFNARSIMVLVIALTLAMIGGRVIAAIMRRVTKFIGNQADKTENLSTVNRLRRIETLIVLSIAIVRMALVLFALYFWWVFTHPTQQSGALIGASAVFAVLLGATLTPVLRDFAFGSVMMAEHWYGVGDYVTLEPMGNGAGVVERVTLRSTKIRSITGEVVWIPNQNILGARVVPKGTRMIAMEIFVTDPDKGVQLIKQTNLRLTTGALTIISPFKILSTNELEEDTLWHITALCEVAPGREWLITDYAVKIMQDLDEQHNKPQILVHDPLTRYTDAEAEKRFARTIRNARKKKLRRTTVVPVNVTRKKHPRRTTKIQ